MKKLFTILFILGATAVLSGQTSVEVTVESGADVTIEEGIFVSVGTAGVPGTVTNTSNTGLVIKSGSSGSGSLICGGTPNATVERYYSGNVWHLISSPVSNAQSGMFTGLYLQSHDESTNTYSDIIPTTIPLPPGQGFALFNYNTATADFIGTLNTGDVSHDLTRSASGDTRGWNLVGNPYSSSIDWNAASGWTKTNVGGSTYRLDSDGSGNWAVWNGGTGTNNANQYIASGQGFFVSVNNDGSNTGVLGFSSEVRSNDNTAFYKSVIDELVKLKITGNGYSDEAVVYIDENSTFGYDNQSDAYKIFSFEASAPGIYLAGADNMAINAIPETQPVAVGVKVEQGMGTYTINASEINGFSQVYLRDEYTGIITDMITESYTFDYVQDVLNRFTLHFSPLDVEDHEADISSIFMSGNKINVMLTNGTNAQVFIYNINGQLIKSTTCNDGLNQINMDGKTAYYIVKLVTDVDIITKKVFVK